MPHYSAAARMTLAAAMFTIMSLAGRGEADSGADAADEPAGRAESSSARQLSREIAALREEIDRLRAQREADWLSTRRADEIRRLVADVLTDADTRQSLLADPPAAGWDDGFVIGSPDGNFFLRFNAHLQVRFIYNRQGGGADADRWGFENRRIKPGIRGHIVDPSWRYKIRGSFDRSDGSLSTSDMYLQKELGGGWSLRAGQFKPPFLREYLLPASSQSAVERSLVDGALRQGRSDGIELAHEGERFAWRVMLNDGFERDDTPALVEDVEFAATARAELLIGGSWGQFKELATRVDDEPGALVGAAVHVEKEESGTVGAQEEQLLTWTVDASAETGGAGLFVALVGRHLDAAERDQFGLVAQADICLVPDVWDLFLRYEWGDDDAPGSPDLHVITAGVNRYFRGHDLKLMVDVGYGLNPVAEFWASSGAGWRADDPGRDGQIVVRTQFQLVF